jgi:membrane-associated phospholipid phosphatase
MSGSGSHEFSGAVPLLGHVKPNLQGWIALLRRAPRGSHRIGLSLWSGRLAPSAAVTLAILAAVMAKVDSWAADEARMLAPAIRWFFYAITDFGQSGWFLWPVGIVLIMLALLATTRIGHVGTLFVAAVSVRLSFIFAAIAVPGLFVMILKSLIGRARPFVDGGVGSDLYDPFVWKAAYASLPSGHAATAFSAAVAIGTIWPQARPYLWAYALLIAVSRVVVLAHYPSDVIAGAVVGVVGAVLVRNWFAARRLAFTVEAGGAIRRLATPSWQRIKALAHRLCAS